MELIYRHLAVNKTDADSPDVKTHTLTFREGAPTGAVPDLMMAGGNGSSATLKMPEAEAQSFQLGAVYNVTFTPAPAPKE